LNIHGLTNLKQFLAVCERVRTGLRSGQGEDESGGGIKFVRPVRIDEVARVRE
jgi:hypothetical protein